MDLHFEDGWRDIVRVALTEDRADHDVTTGLLGGAGASAATGVMVAESAIVVAGLGIARAVFHELDPAIRFEALQGDGDQVPPRTGIARVRGPVSALLAGERTALNFVQHLSGIATATRTAVMLAGDVCRITDTRKTVPGLRSMAKYAVRLGGGMNNRSSLAEAVFFKDNHWAVLRASGQRLRDVLARVPRGMTVVVEVDTEAELLEALESGATRILVDNQDPATLRRWAARAGDRVEIEASGGITPDRAGEYAAAGADYIAIGSITHSAPAAPIGLSITLD